MDDITMDRPLIFFNFWSDRIKLFQNIGFQQLQFRKLWNRLYNESLLIKAIATTQESKYPMHEIDIV